MSKLRSHALEQCGKMLGLWSVDEIATTGIGRAGKGMGGCFVTDCQDQGLMVAQ